MHNSILYKELFSYVSLKVNGQKLVSHCDYYWKQLNPPYLNSKGTA